MTKASDNVFPRLLISEGGSTATPAADLVTIYAKANGLLYSKDDAGTETALGGGGAGDVATDAIFDTKGDLPVGTGADTASKLAAGANGLVLTAASGEATGLKWAVPTVPYVTADSSADVSLTGDAIADATGVSISLAAGTWLVLGVVTFSAATAARDYCLMQITTAADAVVGEARGAVSSGSPEAWSTHAVVAPGTTTTYKIRGQSGRTGNKILQYGQGTNIGTRITAIRLL